MPSPTMFNIAKHARGGAIDDAISEIFEVAPAGAARVHHGGHAGAEAEFVRQHAVVSGPGALHARGRKQVNVRVDQSRRDVEAADVDDRPCLRGIDAGAHRRDLPVGNRDVHDGIDLVARIDDMSALEQDLIADLGAGSGTSQRDDQQTDSESATGVSMRLRSPRGPSRLAVFAQAQFSVHRLALKAPLKPVGQLRALGRQDCCAAARDRPRSCR